MLTSIIIILLRIRSIFDTLSNIKSWDLDAISYVFLKQKQVYEQKILLYTDYLMYFLRNFTFEDIFKAYFWSIYGIFIVFRACF